MAELERKIENKSLVFTNNNKATYLLSVKKEVATSNYCTFLSLSGIIHGIKSGKEYELFGAATVHEFLPSCSCSFIDGETAINEDSKIKLDCFKSGCFMKAEDFFEAEKMNLTKAQKEELKKFFEEV